MNIAYLWVALGGALGSVARFWLNGFVAEKIGNSFPWGILIINLIGSFLIGIFAAITNPDGPLDPRTRMFTMQFFMVGICGGFTTFSSFSRDTLRLLQERHWLYAGGNVLFSFALCLLAVWLGYLLGSLFATMRGN